MSGTGKIDTHGVKGSEWIGFDLDGTLAEYHGWKGYWFIGKPIPNMVSKIKEMHNAGKRVKIMTARVAPISTDPKKHGGGMSSECRRVIRLWCKKYLGFIPEITHEKDHLMIALYDDRAVQVETNTGKIIGKEVS